MPPLPTRLFLPASVFLAAALVGACSHTPDAVHGDGPPAREVDVSLIPDAVPRVEPVSRYGNPEHYDALGKRYYVRDSRTGYTERGIASWYGSKFHNRRTSSGEPYDMYAMTAAHTTLPIPVYARVSNLANGRSVVVRINDRGPFHDNRIIDLSWAAASKLGITATGTGLVEVRTIDPRKPEAALAKAAPATPGRAPEIFLQVGAFSDRQNAQRLRETLQRSMRPAVQVVEGPAGNRTLYRVRVGPLRSVEQADHLVVYLHQFGIHEPRVIIE